MGRGVPPRGLSKPQENRKLFLFRQCSFARRFAERSRNCVSEVAQNWHMRFCVCSRAKAIMGAKRMSLHFAQLSARGDAPVVNARARLESLDIVFAQKTLLPSSCNFRPEHYKVSANEAAFRVSCASATGPCASNSLLGPRPSFKRQPRKNKSFSFLSRN